MSVHNVGEELLTNHGILMFDASTERWHPSSDGRALKHIQVNIACAFADCNIKLRPPLVHCSRCKHATYCSHDCFLKSEHELECLILPVVACPPDQTPDAAEDTKAMNTSSQAIAEPSATDLKVWQDAAIKISELSEVGDTRAMAAMESLAMQAAQNTRSAFPETAAAIYGNLGRCFAELGQLTKAVDLRQQEIVIYKELCDATREGRARLELGSCYARLGLHIQAFELLGQAKTLAQGTAPLAPDLILTDEQQTTPYTKLLNKVQELQEKHDWRTLAAMQGEALQAAENMCDAAPDNAEFIYSNFGWCNYNLANFEVAINLFERARSICDSTVDQSGQARAATQIGMCYLALGQGEKSLEMLHHRLTILERTGDRASQANVNHRLGNCHYQKGLYERAISLHLRALDLFREMCNRAGEASACIGLGNCYRHQDVVKAFEMLELAFSIFSDIGDCAGKASAYASLAKCYSKIGQHSKAVELHRKTVAILQELDKYRVEEGTAYSDLGAALAELGDSQAAVCALSRSLRIFQHLEEYVGDHDEQRVSFFEQHQTTYQLMQGLLLGHLGQPGWALAVAEQAKARSLAHRLGVRDRSQGASDFEYEDMCKMWWSEVQQQARAEGGETRTLEFSFLIDGTLAIWVLSGKGELLCSVTTPSPDPQGKGMAIQQLLAEVRKSLNVQGRNAMVSRPEEGEEEVRSLQRGIKCKVCQLKFNQCTCARPNVRESSLRELYQVLIAPVEAHLKGSPELLIVPHRELFEVPWAALMSANGNYLIQDYVIRLAPSLLVARQAADKVQQHKTEKIGHVLVVGNPLPTRPEYESLPYAEQEAQHVEDILTQAKVEVLQQHSFRSDQRPRATKTNVKASLEGARWVHFSCHGDIDTDSLVLASANDHVLPGGFPLVLSDLRWQMVDPSQSLYESGVWDQNSDLSMQEVQGNEKMAGVRLGYGATVVLSACNSGRGDIKSEGVVGLARSFLLANAAATVVSLWAVSSLLQCMDNQY